MGFPKTGVPAKRKVVSVKATAVPPKGVAIATTSVGCGSAGRMVSGPRGRKDLLVAANRKSCDFVARGKVPRDTLRGRRHNMLGIFLFARGHCLTARSRPYVS